MTVYRILYRGSLSSCNYSCDYCPFAKTTNTQEELARDEQQLNDFVDWVAANPQKNFGIMITPWGEAIIHGYYRRAMNRLSHLPNVDRVAMQTNLSCKLSDFEAANKQSLALWATYHPSQVSLSRFLERCNDLDQMGIRFSVGTVGLRESFDQIKALRAELRADIYLWVNAFKRDPNYYEDKEIEWLREIDPYFDLNRNYYPSVGKRCRAGETAFTVDGDGNIRRCHFIDNVLGNIYRDDIFTRLQPRDCTQTTCGCHIGYVNRQELELDLLFGDNILERIPTSWPQVNSKFVSLS